MSRQKERCWLFVPGHSQKMVDKALGLDVDVIIFDLEDGVPPDKKESARCVVAEALGQPASCAKRFVRVHAAQSAMTQDLQAIVRPGLAGVVLSKVEEVEHIEQVDTALSALEKSVVLPEGEIKLVALVESARGLVQAPVIANASSRMAGLMLGAEDYALDMGFLTLMPDEADALLYARSGLAVAAASQKLQAIDKAFLDLGDAAGLVRETQRARLLGFSGKCLIHPAQIEAVHKGFLPTEEEVAIARRIVVAFAAAEANGSGVTVVDGRMVDLPIVERARRLLVLNNGKSAD